MVHLATRKSDSGDFLPVRWPSAVEIKTLEIDPDPPVEIDPDPPVETPVSGSDFDQTVETTASAEKLVKTEHVEDDNVDEHDEILGFRVDDGEVEEDNKTEEFSNVDFDSQEIGESEFVNEKSRTFEELVDRMAQEKTGKT